MAVNLEGVDADFLKAIYAARDEYKAATGKDIQINSAFRTQEEQAALRQQLGNKAAPPGKSQHEHGFAMDINSAELNEMDSLGLLAKHGLARPVKGEPWHVELAGDRAGRIAKPNSGQQNMATSAPSPTIVTQVTPPSQVDLLAAGAMQRNDAATSALNELLKQQQDVITSARDSLMGTADDAALVTGTKQLAEANAANRTIAFSTKIGANPDAATEALSRLVDQSNALFEKQRKVAARLENAGTPRNMFKDPLRFAADYLLAPQNKLRLDAVTTQLNSTNNQIKWINDSVQNYKQTMNAIAQPITTESASAAARMVKTDVELQAAKLDLERLKLNSENVLTTNRLQNDNLSIALKRRDQEIQEQNLVIQRGQQAMQAQILQLNMQDKIQGDQAKTGFLEMVNLGRKVNGDLSPFRNFAELNTYMEVNPTQKPIIAAQYNAGAAASKIGQATVASTPYGAMQYIAQTGAKLDPGRQQVIDTAMSAYQAAGADPEIQKLMKNKSTAQEVANTVVRKKFAEYHSDITRGGQDNPYAAPPLQSLLSDPELSKTYFANNVLKALLASGSTALPFTQAVDLLVKDMNAGKVSMQQVDSELGFFADKIKFYNNDTRRYQATAGISNMTQVNVPLNVTTVNPRMMGWQDPLNVFPQQTRLTKIDISDPVKRSEFLNKAKAATLGMPVTTSKTGVQ